MNDADIHSPNAERQPVGTRRAALTRPLPLLPLQVVREASRGGVFCVTIIATAGRAACWNPVGTLHAPVCAVDVHGHLAVAGGQGAVGKSTTAEVQAGNPAAGALGDSPTHPLALSPSHPLTLSPLGPSVDRGYNPKWHDPPPCDSDLPYVFAHGRMVYIRYIRPTLPPHWT